jgi:KAP-like P-loop domain-containing protein
VSSDESTTTSTNELIDRELNRVIDDALATDEISASMADKRLGLTAADLRAHVLANRDQVGEPLLLTSLGSVAYAAAVQHLRTRVLNDGVLPLLRTLINDRMAPLLWSTFAVSDAPGLDRVRDSKYTVETRSTTRFLDVAGQIRTGAIGIAGARGVGKTTVIDYYCTRWLKNPIAVSVSAPVQYDPRDFVLHLYAELCRTVIVWFDQRYIKRYWSRRCIRHLVLAGLGLLAAVLYIWAVVGPDVLLHPDRIRQHLAPPWLPLWPAGLLLIGSAGSLVIALRTAAYLAVVHRRALGRPLRWLFSNKVIIARDDDDVVAVASRHLTRIRFLQTQTTGWSGKLAMPIRAEFGFTGSTQRAEQPLTYPEVVHELREFLAWITWQAPGNPAVIVAVDELDKIDDPERAQQFINEIKGIFGVDRTQFLVSLSDDALASFERRGLPIRDAFDSAFDEIVRIEPLSLEDTCTLLKSRVIGVSDLFCALAHCMAGGLARDIIRTARSMRAVADDDAPDIERVCVGLVAADLQRKVHAFQQATSKLGGAIYATNFIRTLRGLRAAPATLLTASSALLPADRSQDDPELHWQAATYVYHCATLLEVFTGDLTADRFTERRAVLETLAAAKQELGTHPQLAWLLVDEFREAWGLATVPTE